ncbi:atherin-like [Passer montanus]|uniref:atherin-like n=1 Tax=Passer montanus TaxID=9160 RepID=UPI00195FD43C|nr:atherin-like [Passer montanus]
MPAPRALRAAAPRSAGAQPPPGPFYPCEGPGRASGGGGRGTTPPRPPPALAAARGRLPARGVMEMPAPGMPRRKRLCRGCWKGEIAEEISPHSSGKK